jgi:antitoxin VapB
MAYANGQEAAMSEPRTVSLFRNGRNQAVRIPVEFELPGDEAIMRKEGDRLIIEPKVRRKTLAEVLDELEPVPDFPDIDDKNLPPLRDVDLS